MYKLVCTELSAKCKYLILMNTVYTGHRLYTKMTEKTKEILWSSVLTYWYKSFVIHSETKSYTTQLWMQIAKVVNANCQSEGTPKSDSFQSTGLLSKFQRPSWPIWHNLLVVQMVFLVNTKTSRPYIPFQNTKTI